MTLEPFFKKFDALADAPDAVAKTRELILNFAVTGRLSEQRAGDSPVSELLEMLSAARSRRARRGERVSSAPAVDSVLECPIRVPKHWAWISLAEIGTLSGGMTPSKTKASFWNGDINWFSSKDVRPDELTESELKITREATEATRLQIYSPGCLIFVARSGILKRTFPVSILRVNGTVNQDLKVLCPFVSGLERYIQLMLRGMTAFILTSLVKTGMTVQSLKFEEFEAQPFPFPPLAEQKRIVAKVDELMALCDRLEAQQEEREIRHAALVRASLNRFVDAPTPTNLTFLFHKSYTITPADLRKSILTLAVRGQLVPQHPHDRPVNDAIKAAAKKDGRPPDMLRHVNDKDVPFEIPASWRWVTVADIAVARLGKMLDKEKNRGEAYPYLRNTNVHWFRFQLDSIKTMRFERSELSEYRVEPGDVLICEGGHGIARSAVWTGAIPVIMFQKALHRVRPLSCLDGHFLTFCLWVYDSLEFLPRYFTGAGIPHFTGKSLAKVVIPLPPPAEQRRIVAKVEHLMLLVNKLEAQLAVSRATASKLLDAIVGELTT
jgi:type I restriction enzyme S subunit